MSRWPILFAIAVFALASAAAIPLFAQPGGYQPAPPLSPWLNLYQKQGGPVDNYHMYVQPQLQLQDTLHAQQMGIETNAAAVDAVGERNMSQRDASFAAPQQTGASATFFNHGTYFNTFRGIGAGAGGTPGTAPGLNRPNFGNTGGFGGGMGGIGGGMGGIGGGMGGIGGGMGGIGGGIGGGNLPAPNLGGVGRAGIL